jgi:hypothetical protein
MILITLRRATRNSARALRGGLYSPRSAAPRAALRRGLSVTIPYAVAGAASNVRRGTIEALADGATASK